MNERVFTIDMFKDMIERLMRAHSRKDGVALQNLESEIITKYQGTTMNNQAYVVLKETCSILLDDIDVTD